MLQLTVQPVDAIRGEVTIPGDKSVSHRAVLLGALTDGKVEITNYLMGDDCLHTVEFVRQLGVTVEVQREQRRVTVHGVGFAGLKEPGQILEVGNAGTLIRIGAGLLAACPFFTVVTGDASIRQRPMSRIVEPLTLMGAEIWGRAENSLAPLAIRGGQLRGIHYIAKTASAQVKSAILLAGLAAEGETVVEEPAQSRDHTERMLRYLGVDVAQQALKVRIKPQKTLQAQPIYVPGDISSAAFVLAAGLIRAEEVIIRNVGYNSSRAGIIQVMQQMGGRVEVFNDRELNGEPVVDIRVVRSPLRGIHLGGAIIPNIIDELPVLAVLATQAEGQTLITDAAELRVKECDRIKTIVHGLKQLGARIEERPDGMLIEGPVHLQGGRVDSYGDHRIAMSLAVAGLAAKDQVTINNTACVRTSFPDFPLILQSVSGSTVITESELQVP